MTTIRFIFFLLLTTTVSGCLAQRQNVSAERKETIQPLFDAEKTHVVIAGVLKWQSPELASFSDRNRKDLELYNRFIEMGIDKNQMTLMLDEQATLAAMKSSIENGMKACGIDGTFIFYYAGHGTKGKTTHYLCNYDMGAKTDTWFDVELISKAVAGFFKGKRIILLADCCYSGSLLSQAGKIRNASPGVEVLVLTSATSSNVSTGNWTFTQTILDALRGDDLCDLDDDEVITLAEVNNSIADAMKFREHQKNGYVCLGPDDTKITFHAAADKGKSERGSGVLRGQYVNVLNAGNWKVARVTASGTEELEIEYYNYSDKQREKTIPKKVQIIPVLSHAEGTKIKVLWEKDWYEAVVKQTIGDFMFIQYNGYDDTWNEWVMYDRIRTGNEINVKIEWYGNWYPGIVLDENNGKYLVTYTGYDRAWDEWVTSDRLKW